MERPKFQRRHYEVIADVLRESSASSRVIGSFVMILLRDNANFDKQRFLDRCRNAI